MRERSAVAVGKPTDTISLSRVFMTKTKKKRRAAAARPSARSKPFAFFRRLVSLPARNSRALLPPFDANGNAEYASERAGEGARAREDADNGANVASARQQRLRHCGRRLLSLVARARARAAVAAAAAAAAAAATAAFKMPDEARQQPRVYALALSLVAS